MTFHDLAPRLHPVRIPVDLLARADALIPAVSADRELGQLSAGRVSRAAVVRLALAEGLDVLARRLVYG
jgi:hypothetical protein